MRALMTATLALSLTVFASFLNAGAAETCYHKSDEVQGLNRICYYSCPSGEAAITIKAAQVCPLSIKR
jgi:hypothetical protein